MNNWLIAGGVTGRDADWDSFLSAISFDICEMLVAMCPEETYVLDSSDPDAPKYAIADNAGYQCILSAAQQYKKKIK